MLRKYLPLFTYTFTNKNQPNVVNCINIPCIDPMGTTPYTTRKKKKQKRIAFAADSQQIKGLVKHIFMKQLPSGKQT